MAHRGQNRRHNKVSKGNTDRWLLGLGRRLGFLGGGGHLGHLGLLLGGGLGHLRLGGDGLLELGGGGLLGLGGDGFLGLGGGRLHRLLGLGRGLGHLLRLGVKRLLGLLGVSGVLGK